MDSSQINGDFLELQPLIYGNSTGSSVTSTWFLSTA